MFTAHSLDDTHAKNPLAALFNQAVREIALLSRWIKHDSKCTGNALCNNNSQDIAFDLAGLGDLHVTVGGGRNSKLGQHLGTGSLLKDILQSEMRNVTVEGVDTAKQLLPGFRLACEKGRLQTGDFPLTCAILDVVENNNPFEFNFELLPA